MATRLRTPVALFVFNRPRTTERVFEAIRAAHPRKLFVVADGPRADRPGEASLCEATRRVVDDIEPDCEVIREYAATNLGCGRRIASGIARVFSEVEEAIFLEDDCLPDPSFFPYCDELLARYRYHDRVMMVSGTNDLIQWKPEARSYHYARYGSVWGWATWRRAFRHYDFEMRSWALPDARRRLSRVLDDAAPAAHLGGIFDQVARGGVDTWDYQWTYACLMRDGLTVVPSRNLVSNIGIGRGATHTTHLVAGAHHPRYPMRFPLQAPPAIEPDRDYDRTRFSWAVWQPETAAIIARAAMLIDAGRNAPGLLLVDEAIGGAELPHHREQLRVLKARALVALGRPTPAREVLMEALTDRPDSAPAGRLGDHISTGR